MKKKLLSLALAAVMVVMMGTPALATDYRTGSIPFEDVPRGHWAREAISYCWSYYIVEGVSETEFEPESTLTRAQFITMMERAAFEDEIQAQTTSSDNWYSGCVRYLSNNGYLDGISTDDASLNQGISRQEMALLIYNLYKNSNSELNIDTSDVTSSISDISAIGSNYLTAIEYCYAVGLITGYEDGSFNPDATLTRAEACTVIRRTLYWDDIDGCSVKDLNKVGISTDLVYQELSNLIIENINDWREENGLKRLQTLWFMNEACMVRAEEISVSFSHTRPDGRTSGTVYEDLFGTELGKVENIVANVEAVSKTLSEAADALFENWKGSSGHNTNILSDNEYIGCGIYVTNGIVYSATHFTGTYYIEKYGYEDWVK
ncbi:MAG: S-layer homology domain-containing protein [Oscillospiraceae bacterium]|nr:S-layer homology domain-containing protein [Oscillospiraceae bacterium]